MGETIRGGYIWLYMVIYGYLSKIVGLYPKAKINSTHEFQREIVYAL